MKRFFILLIILFCCYFQCLTANASDYFEQGKAAFYAKDYERAKNLFKEELELNPENYECVYLLGHTYYYQDKKQWARRQYYKVATFAPEGHLKTEAKRTLYFLMNNGSIQEEESENNYYDILYKKKETPIRWRNRQVTVYIERSEYKQMIKAAFDEWQKESNGLISFTFISREPTAQIKVYPVSKLTYKKAQEPWGLTTYYYEPETKYFITAKIELLDTVRSGEKMTADSMYSVALHEIGHAIGITGHSPSSGDLMFPYAKSRLNFRTISKRDLNTLKKIYGEK